MDEHRFQLSRTWLVLAGILAALEVIFIVEAILADMNGLQRIFGVFVGLAILAFGVLLFAASIVFYGWS
jgi:hypothetical protein